MEIQEHLANELRLGLNDFCLLHVATAFVCIGSRDVCCRKAKRGYPTDQPSQYELAISRLKLKQWVHDSAQYVQLGMTASEFLVNIRNEINQHLEKYGAELQISANQALNKLALCESQAWLSKAEQQLLMEQIVIGDLVYPLAGLNSIPVRRSDQINFCSIP